MGCSFHTIDARVAKVYIGHKDPDPSVAGDGIKLLEDAKIDVGYYDKKYNETIAKENANFFEEARQRAKEVDGQEITPDLTLFESELTNFTLNDFSEEAQREMIDKMDLKFKMGSDAYKSYLLKLDLIKSIPKANTTKPTGLGILLLGKQPELKFPQARVKFTIRRSFEDPLSKILMVHWFSFQVRLKNILN